MNTKHKKTIIVFGLLICALLCNVSANVCECDSCESCTDALNNINCSEVKLTTDITNHKGGVCINNPININNKVFDCQKHIVDIFIYNKQNYTLKNCSPCECDSCESCFNLIDSNNSCKSIHPTVNLSTCYKESWNWFKKGEYKNTTKEDINYDGICECDSCESCTEKLNDYFCYVVRLTQNITDVSGDCILNPTNIEHRLFDCQHNAIQGKSVEEVKHNGIFYNENTFIQNCEIINMGVTENKTTQYQSEVDRELIFILWGVVIVAILGTFYFLLY